MKIGIQQRVLPIYRVPFFDKLGASPGIQLSVFAGMPRPEEGIHHCRSLSHGDVYHALNRYLGSGTNSLYLQTNLLKWLRWFRPDVLILGSNPRLVANYVAILLMKRWKRPVIGWTLGELERTGSTYLHRARSAVLRASFQMTDAIIGYSSKAAQDFRVAGVPAERIFVAHNSSDTSESERYLVQLGQNLNWLPGWMENRGLVPEKPVILYVGRLTSAKRVENLIKAYTSLSDMCQLLIVGDGPLRQHLESLAASEHVDVRFLGSRIGEELARCFIASQLFVLPGSGGLAIHQAMSYGKPILVSQGDGTEKDIVRERRNGLYMRPNDVGDIRDKIRWYLENPLAVKEMGRESLRIIREEINIDRMVASFLKTIDFVRSQ